MQTDLLPGQKQMVAIEIVVIYVAFAIVAAVVAKNKGKIGSGLGNRQPIVKAAGDLGTVGRFLQ